MQHEPAARELARTHTCGALTVSDVGQGRRPARLGAPRPRSRVAGVPRHPRSSRHHAGRGARRRGDAGGRQARSVPSTSSGVLGRRGAARAGVGQPKVQTGEIEVAVARDAAAERREDAAVSDRRRDAASPRTRGCKYRYLDLRRPRMQHNMIAAAQGDDGDPAVLRRAGVPRDRDADADQVDARRGARLPGAEPRPSRRVLRAAAVAADLQADPDDRRHGSLLPDREVLPRRGPARRSAAGVHPGRPRDLVRHRGPGVLDRRAVHGAADGADRPARRRGRSAGCRTRRRSRGTDPTSRTCAAGWRSTDLSAAVRRTAAFARVQRRDRGGRGGARLRRARRRAKYSRRELDELVEQAKQLGAAGLVWARSAEGAVQSPALKAAGEAAIRQALEIARRRRRRISC